MLTNVNCVFHALLLSKSRASWLLLLAPTLERQAVENFSGASAPAVGGS